MPSKLYIWPQRMLYFGPLEYLEPHTYGATTLHIGIYGPFYIKFHNTGWLPCHCAIVPAGVKHELHVTHNTHAKLFIENNSIDYHYLKQRFQFNNFFMRFYDEETIECFRHIYEGHHNHQHILSLLNNCLKTSTNNIPILDTRVAKAISLMHADPEKSFSENFLANETALSSSRFRHLFNEQMGISYRHYRVWRRLLEAGRQISQTDNLTAAALDAGFSDLSHFSNHYRNTFGIKPSAVFRGLTEFHSETVIEPAI